MTAQDLIRGSLISLGVLGSGVSMESQEADDALAMLQDLVDSMNASRLCISVQDRRTYTWTANQSTRTIGTAGQLVGPRPLWVDQWAVIPLGETLEHQAKPPMTREQYARLVDKALTATVWSELAYEPTVASGTLTVWPVPTTAATLVLYVPLEVTAVATLNTALSFAPGYREFLRYSLAKRLAPAYKQAWTPALADLLRGAHARLVQSNGRVEPRQNDPFLTRRRGVFDIDRGSYR